MKNIICGIVILMCCFGCSKHLGGNDNEVTISSGETYMWVGPVTYKNGAYHFTKKDTNEKIVVTGNIIIKPSMINNPKIKF